MHCIPHGHFEGYVSYTAICYRTDYYKLFFCKILNELMYYVTLLICIAIFEPNHLGLAEIDDEIIHCFVHKEELGCSGNSYS